MKCLILFGQGPSNYACVKDRIKLNLSFLMELKDDENHMKSDCHYW